MKLTVPATRTKKPKMRCMAPPPGWPVLLPIVPTQTGSGFKFAAVLTPLPKREGSKTSNQAFQQILQFPHFWLHRVRRLWLIADVHAETTVVPAAGELVDDFAVLNFTLPDSDLKFLHVFTRIAQADVTDKGV